jgi:two-component system cell cycle response regulator
MSKSEMAKILCVDDDPGILDALERVLRHDFHFLRASSGQEGLQVLSENQDCAIVLSDHRMPQTTGLEFLNEAKKIVPDAVLAILSGQMDMNEIADAINKTRIHRFILKPWDNEYLRIQMLEALKEHMVFRERNLLERLAITDPVTQLYNHRHFQDRLRIEMDRANRHGRPLSLILADIDHFKRFNDEFGHPEGDVLLRQVAFYIESHVRNIDVVSRYGGEEFTIILPDTELDEAMRVAERVRASFENKPLLGPKSSSSPITISLGVASYPANASESKGLVVAADKAMYAAKNSGRNRTVRADSL